MAHPFPPNLKVGHLNAATVTNHPLVANRLEFATIALPLLSGPKDPFTEEPVFLGPQGPVVDSFWLFYFSIGPVPDHLRGS
jgi:hypothetical protein